MVSKKGRERKGVSWADPARLHPNFRPELFSGPNYFQAHYVHPISILARFQNQLSAARVFSSPIRSLVPSLLLPAKMEDANNETDLEINYNSEASNGDKRKREGKLRSKVWQHFTKIIKEDGRCDKCQCNHCQKLFTCSSRSGTTHLLRHITDGICPVFKKDKDKILPISYMRPGMDPRTGLLPWKFEQGLGQASAQQCMDVEVDYGAQTPSPLPLKTIEDEYGAHTPLPSRGKLPHSQPKGDRWMNEFKSCVAKHVELSNKLVELSNGKIPVNGPDYSGTALVKCLNELEDIAPSSDMYLDAFQILRDDDRERESFILLPPEARRRWLQRMLHQRHPLRYSLNV